MTSREAESRMNFSSGYYLRRGAVAVAASLVILLGSTEDWFYWSAVGVMAALLWNLVGKRLPGFGLSGLRRLANVGLVVSFALTAVGLLWQFEGLAFAGVASVVVCRLEAIALLPSAKPPQ